MTTPTIEQVHVMLLEIRDREPVFGRLDNAGGPVLFFPSMMQHSGLIQTWAPGHGWAAWDELMAGKDTHRPTGLARMQRINAAFRVFAEGYPHLKLLHVPGDTRTFRKLRHRKEN